MSYAGTIQELIDAAKRRAAQDDWTYMDLSVPGQELVGIYREVREVHSDFGTRNIYVFTEYDTGRTVNVPGAGHFEYLWSQKDIRQGDLVYIKYCGKQKNKERVFHRFQVSIVARAGTYPIPTGVIEREEVPEEQQEEIPF